jgi:hypothetical protein
MSTEFDRISSLRTFYYFLSYLMNDQRMSFDQLLTPNDSQIGEHLPQRNNLMTRKQEHVSRDFLQFGESVILIIIRRISDEETYLKGTFDNPASPKGRKFGRSSNILSLTYPIRLIVNCYPRVAIRRGGRSRSRQGSPDE